MENDKHCLIIHIGTHKTGNTALQIFLMKNAEQLRKYGILYPDLVKTWQKYRGIEASSYVNGKLLQSSITRNWPEKEKENLWKILRHYLKNYDVVLSDPAIWSHRSINTVEAIKDYAKRYDNIKLVVYFRRQDLYIESLWNEFIKEGHMTDTLNDYIEKSHYVMDYNRKLNDIASVIGKENISVRIYERGQFAGERGDITSDFLKTLGKIRGELPETWEHIKMPGMVNPRLDGDMLMARLYFNQAYGDEAEYQGEEIKKHFMNANYDADKKYGYLTKEQREKIMREYEEGNREIAINYLGRENGVLFYDENFEYPLYCNNITERERYIIKVLGELSAKQNADLRKANDWRYELMQGLNVSKKIAGRVMRKTFSPIAFHMLNRWKMEE